ncbi:formylglycine-generating enzyme family protein [Aeromicrobium sp. Root236]|uniref:formylglycine-generating enzyme family protein n=1 Tax=Aeromicrobium sp. Root236 TaxID=1736498 RepID=UPI001F3AEA28|nr:formylglycine-generating enzyme family protein [Aeromicrobium sp. Root236]
MTHRACCAPSGGPTPVALRVRDQSLPQTPAAHTLEQVVLSGGTYRRGDHHGDGHPLDGERPVHDVTVRPFSVDAVSVTNAQFATFVDATGYVTEAERSGFSAVFHLYVEAPDSDVLGRASGTPWWVTVRGADWCHPEGSASGIGDRDEHPVVHASWGDASAYCSWTGRRLPTEAEWEFAARGGLEGARYPWGDELLDADGRWQCNIWQGEFPHRNSADDGFHTTAPVRSYAPNGFGLWQMVGNVWEWCADRFDAQTYSLEPSSTLGTDRVIRGGSYLCHDSYCNRYRVAARSANTPTSTSGNLGFRTVRDA